MVLVQAVVGLPSGSNTGQPLDHVEIPLQIDVGFGIPHTRFAQEVDRETNTTLPKFAETLLRAFGIDSSDELFAHGLDLACHSAAEDTLGQPTCGNRST